MKCHSYVEVVTLRASLFITCLIDNLYPQVAESMVKILDRYGVRIDVPMTQTCCGQPAYNSGYVDEARTVGATLLDAFEDAEYVITGSGSCAGMIHHDYPFLFQSDERLAARAEKLKAKTYEFSQFLVNVLGVRDVGARFPHRVTYHPSCHGARLLGIKNEPETLLSRVKEIDLVELPYASDCCGFGGTFAVKMAEISAAMVTEKTAHIHETNASFLVGTDMGCLMNIDGRLKREGSTVQVKHLAELLYEGILLEEGASR